MAALKGPEYPKHGHSDKIVLELYKYHSVQSIYEKILRASKCFCTIS